MKSTEVSIIIPYDKDRGYLETAIRTAEQQACVIPYQSEHSVGYNINRGLELVKTPYFCILAEDDWLHFNSIAWKLARIKAEKCDFIHSYGVAVYPHVQRRITWTMPRPTLEDMLQMNRICGGTTLYKTDLVDRFGGFDEELWTAEEYDWHMKIMSQSATLGFLPKETYYYRRHELQKSLGNRDREYQDKRIALIEEIRNRYR